MSTPPQDTNEFEQAHSEKGLIGEFWEFLLDNKKFWMIPIIVVLLAIGGLLIAGGSGLAPFIYTIF